MRTEVHVAAMLAEMEVHGMGFEPGVLQAHAAALQQRCTAIQVGWGICGRCCLQSMLREPCEAHRWGTTHQHGVCAVPSRRQRQIVWSARLLTWRPPGS